MVPTPFPGVGVVVNVVAVIVGSAIGLAFGRMIPDRFRSIAFKALGLSTSVIGAKMAISTNNPLVLVGSLVLGALIGEAIGIERGLERMGHWLQSLVYRAPSLAPAPAQDEPGRKGRTLVEGFVTASLLYCVGAMTVLGSLRDGLGDPTLLYVKALLDGVASIALASTLGVGVALSVIPIAIVQGGLALGATSLEPYLTQKVITELTSAGGALILAIGIDLLDIKRLPVGNMLPAIVIAGVLGAYFG